MSESVIVTTKQGLLRGIREKCKNGFEFISFCGIPFAKPPLDELRFKAPVPFGKWKGVRDAIEDGEKCYAFDPLLRTLGGSEDCLFLNVFTPEVSNSSMAVMVYIHGGGFAFGSGGRNFCGPEFLIQKNIVLVTINYRVGVLGFLHLADTSLGVHGNAGLKDQVMALHWVQENISAFGGDPQNVTIFGESAGSTSVQLHLLSPLTKGLFHKAIMQSGSALALWGLGHKDYSSALLEKLGEETQDDTETLELLQSVSKEELLEAQNSTPWYTGESQFGPVVEGNHDFQPFLTDKPANLLKSGNYSKVPIIMGFTTNEGSVFKLLKANSEIAFENLGTIASWNFGVPSSSPKYAEVTRRVKEFFYGKEEPSEENEHIRLRIITDLFFVCGITKSIEEMQRQGPKYPLYAYKFNLRTNLNQFAKLVGLTQEEGACHVDDLFYLFKTNFTPDVEVGSIEESSIDKMTTWWTNFAKFGNPNGVTSSDTMEWPLVGDDLKYLNIDNETSVIRKPDDTNMRFWNDLENYVNDTI